jgi:hypothetical protein
MEQSIVKKVVKKLEKEKSKVAKKLEKAFRVTRDMIAEIAPVCLGSSAGHWCEEG